MFKYAISSALHFLMDYFQTNYDGPGRCGVSILEDTSSTQPLANHSPGVTGWNGKGKSGKTCVL